MQPISLGDIDEHDVEFLECVIVSIAAEYVCHLFWLISFIWFNIHTFQTCAIINEQIGQLRMHFIIHHLINQSNIVNGE